MTALATQRTEIGSDKYAAMIKRKKVFHIVYLTLIYVVLTIWGLIALFPFIWSFYNSFKVSTEILLRPIDFPNAATFTTKNYAAIFSGNLNVGRAYFYSIYISAFVVLGTLVTSAFAAFTLARYRFKGKRIVSILVVACMMFPAFSLIFPLYRLLDTLNLTNNHIGLILPQIALNMGFSTILLTGFFQSLPIEVEESAYIDGSTVIRTLFQIVFPMAKSALITCVIFVFLWSYNDLFLQTFIIKTLDMRPIPYLMATITQQQGTDFGKMTATATLVCLPMLIIYFFLQKHIIKGLTAGAVKG